MVIALYTHALCCHEHDWPKAAPPTVTQRAKHRVPREAQGDTGTLGPPYSVVANVHGQGPRSDQ